MEEFLKRMIDERERREKLRTWDGESHWPQWQDTPDFKITDPGGIMFEVTEQERGTLSFKSNDAEWWTGAELNPSQVRALMKYLAIWLKNLKDKDD